MWSFFIVNIYQSLRKSNFKLKQNFHDVAKNKQTRDFNLRKKLISALIEWKEQKCGYSLSTLFFFLAHSIPGSV